MKRERRGAFSVSVSSKQESVERDSNGVLYYVYSRYTDENPNMKKMGDITLRQEDVFHIPGLGFDGLIGYSPIAMARNAVGMIMACEEYF